MSGSAGSQAAAVRLDMRVMEQARVSRSAAQSLIAGGFVRVNDRPAKSGQRVRPADDVAVTIPAVAAPAPVDGAPVTLSVRLRG